MLAKFLCDVAQSYNKTSVRVVEYELAIYRRNESLAGEREGHKVLNGETDISFKQRTK